MTQYGVPRSPSPCLLAAEKGKCVGSSGAFLSDRSQAPFPGALAAPAAGKAARGRSRSASGKALGVSLTWLLSELLALLTGTDEGFALGQRSWAPSSQASKGGERNAMKERVSQGRIQKWDGGRKSPKGIAIQNVGTRRNLLFS